MLSFNVSCQGKMVQQVKAFAAKKDKQFNLWAPLGRGREPTSMVSAPQTNFLSFLVPRAVLGLKESITTWLKLMFV